MDWNSNAVAYGYQYCGFACQSLYRGYWLTFSDNQGAYPTNPQGASDAFNPTFYKTRVVSSDSGGNIFVQPDVPEAPFTSSYQGWLTHGEGYYLSRAEVSPANNQVAIEWLKDGGAEGITVAQHSGTVPERASSPPATSRWPRTRATSRSRPTAARWPGRTTRASRSPACRTWPRAPTPARSPRPPRVISASGSQPSFGGADVAAVAGVGGGQPSGGPRAGKPAGGSAAARSGSRSSFPVKPTRAAFAKGITLKVARAEGRPHRRLRLDPGQGRPQGRPARQGRASAARIASKGFAAASTTVVARGNTKAKRAGTVKLRLKPTKAAKRAAKRMRKVVLTIKVSQAGAAGKAKVKLR